MKVVEECKLGKRKSKKLIEDIDPEGMRQIGILEEHEKNNNKATLMVEKINNELI